MSGTAGRTSQDGAPVTEEGERAGNVLQPGSLLTDIQLLYISRPEWDAPPARTDLDLAPAIMHVPRKSGQVHDQHHLRECDLNLGDWHAVDEVDGVAGCQLGDDLGDMPK